MAVKYLAGDRLIGTAAERTALSGSTLDTITQTSWKELGRHTFTQAGDTLDTGTIAAKDNLMILIIANKNGTGGQPERLRFNADDGDNYSKRHAENGGNGSSTSTDFIELGMDSEDPEFVVAYVRNVANKEKLLTGHSIARGTAGDGAIGNKLEVVGKWANTSDQITRVQVLDKVDSMGNDKLDTGTELIVLGCDDDEADSGTNFWQEITEQTLTGAAHMTTGTQTFPKYLFGEFVATGSSSTGTRPRLRFNDDAASNYCTRFQNQGGSDETSLNYESLYVSESDIAQGCYLSFFIYNVSDKEKLVIYESVRHNTNGASVLPQRFEGIGKWVNTGGLITEIQVRGSNNTGSDTGYAFATGSTLRIWGAN